MPFDVVEIKSRSNIAEVLAEHGVALARAGRELVGLCPFHEEKTPSFTVNEAKGVYLCFGCSAKGDVVTFIQRKLELPFVAALEYLARRLDVPSTREPFQRTGVMVPPRIVSRPPGVAEFWRRCLRVSHDRAVVSWLQSRGLDPRLVESHDLARTVPAAERFPEWLPAEWVIARGHRLVLPVFDERGRIVTVRVRSVFRRAEPKTRAVLGHTQGRAVMADRLGAWMLSGDERARRVVRAVGVYVAEGEPDFLTLATLTPRRAWRPRLRGDGHPAVLGLFQTAWCWEVALRIPAGTNVTIWPHVDAPAPGQLGVGYKYAYEVRASLKERAFLDERIRWVELTNATDVNELLMMARERRCPPRASAVVMPEMLRAA